MSNGLATWLTCPPAPHHRARVGAGKGARLMGESRDPFPSGTAKGFEYGARFANPDEIDPQDEIDLLRYMAKRDEATPSETRAEK